MGNLSDRDRIMILEGRVVDLESRLSVLDILYTHPTSEEMDKVELAKESPFKWKKREEKPNTAPYQG